MVKFVSAVILMGGSNDHHHSAHDQSATNHHHHDHNLRSAYLHVIADALTSVLAIVALLAGLYFGAAWLDPIMGIVGAVLIARWSVGLLQSSSKILLDWEAPEEERVADLHRWSVGPGIYAAAVSVVTHEPVTAVVYHGRVPSDFRVVHMTVETHRCSEQT